MALVLNATILILSLLDFEYKRHLNAKFLAILFQKHHSTNISNGGLQCFLFVFQNCMVAFNSNAIYWSWKQTQNKCKQCLILNGLINLAKFQLNEYKTPGNKMIWNLWLFLDSSALFLFVDYKLLVLSADESNPLTQVLVFVRCIYLQYLQVFNMEMTSMRNAVLYSFQTDVFKIGHVFQ